MVACEFPRHGRRPGSSPKTTARTPAASPTTAPTVASTLPGLNRRLSSPLGPARLRRRLRRPRVRRPFRRWLRSRWPAVRFVETSPRRAPPRRPRSRRRVVVAGRHFFRNPADTSIESSSSVREHVGDLPNFLQASPHALKRFPGDACSVILALGGKESVQSVLRAVFEIAPDPGVVSRHGARDRSAAARREVEPVGGDGARHVRDTDGLTGAAHDRADVDDADASSGPANLIGGCGRGGDETDCRRRRASRDLAGRRTRDTRPARHAENLGGDVLDRDAGERCAGLERGDDLVCRPGKTGRSHVSWLPWQPTSHCAKLAAAPSSAVNLTTVPSSNGAWHWSGVRPVPQTIPGGSLRIVPGPLTVAPTMTCLDANRACTTRSVSTERRQADAVPTQSPFGPQPTNWKCADGLGVDLHRRPRRVHGCGNSRTRPTTSAASRFLHRRTT